MKIFIAGNFADREKIANWMKKISKIESMEIIYDWTKHTWQGDRKNYALENIYAVRDCEIFVFDVGEQGGLGKDILLGVAITLEKKIYVIGEFPENIFGELIPNDHRFKDFNNFLKYLENY